MRTSFFVFVLSDCVVSDELLLFFRVELTSRQWGINFLYLYIPSFLSFLCSLSDIIECLPGAEVKTDSSTADQSLLLTIVTKMDQRGASRILALRLASRDQRNSILSGLR